MAFLHLVVFVVLAAALEPAMAGPFLSWLNYWDTAVNFQCRGNRVLHYIHSIHHNFYEDRRWMMDCKDFLFPLENCYWTEQTKYDLPWSVKCSGKGLVTGIKSVHHNSYEDRAFQFKCCETPSSARLYLYSCYDTHYLNNYDGSLEYTVPVGNVVRGISSVHNNYYEDRRYSFHVCHMMQY